MTVVLPRNQVLVGDGFTELRKLPSNSVQVWVGSGPYLALRDYGLPPIVWGGRSDCEHEWGESGAGWAKPARPDHSDGQLMGANGRQGSAASSGVTMSAGAFCVHCGAWLGCLGQEPSVELYIKHTVDIMEEVKRVLRPDGVAFFNIGDSYAGSGKGPTGKTGLQKAEQRQGFTGHGPKYVGGRTNGTIPTGEPDRIEGRHRTYQPHHRGGGKFPIALDRRVGRGVRSGTGYELHEPQAMPECKPKDLMLVPERLAIAMQQAGWYVRSRIAWTKHPMPESVRDRSVSAWEHVWVFAKSRSYFWDQEAVRTPLRPKTYTAFGTTRKSYGNDALGRVKADNWSKDVPMQRPAMRDGEPAGANMRNVWHVPPEPSRYEYCSGCDTFFLGPERKLIRKVKHPDGTTTRICPECGRSDAWVAHYAAFPTGLARLCILAATSESGACAECGAPWKRIVDRHHVNPGNRSTNGPKGATGRKHQAGGSAEYDVRLETVTATTGWAPTCTCSTEETVPCVVLDSFFGSGSTGIAARHLGRDWIGIEPSENYAALARHRIERDVPKWARPVMVKKRTQRAPARVQPPLLEVGS